MKKKYIPLLILPIICIGGVLWYLGQGENTLMVRGEVEGTIYSQIIDVPGKIIEINIELGSFVKEGDVIARLDKTDQVYALEQLQISLDRRKLMLSNLLRGVRYEELERARIDVNIAEANYRSTEATYTHAHTNTERLTTLFEIGGLARIELDNAKVQETIAAETLRAARGQVDKAREQLSLLVRGADADTITLAEMDIAEVESRIRQMQETIAKYEIRAVCDGTIISINYSLGSMVNAGYNLADISSENEKYVVCFVPKDESTMLSYGQNLTIRSNGNEYQGEIRYIDIKSQYTPKDLQTSATRNKVSVKLKLLLPIGTTLKPGNRVEVIIMR